MNFLLDTHVIIWLFDNNSPLEQNLRALLADRKHIIFVSIVSLWEMSIKQGLGKLKAPENLLSLLELNGIKILPIATEHAFGVKSLPLLHRDPFDRMLVMQAVLEDLTIVTHDKNIQQYAVPFLKV